MHDWGDEDCVRILKNCKAALPRSGKVVIVEYVLPEIPESGVEELLNVMMSAYTSGGKERTEMEFRILGKQGGFQGFRKVCTSSHFCFLELYN